MRAMITRQQNSQLLVNPFPYVVVSIRATYMYMYAAIDIIDTVHLPDHIL